MRVFATAGHVDHGKSTLVRALTGIDPDRWAEEKQRGLTIDLGFANTTMPSGNEIAFVDVPGHVRFLKNMLAGVGAVDGCLFVVAATEGWKPQSEEHLRILQLLGLRHGIVVLSKIDGVDQEWLDIARLEVSAHLEGTFLQDAPLVAADGLSGNGLGSVVGALENLVQETEPAADCGRARLWVDRSFSVKGSGTVCTGTLLGGSIQIDEEIDLAGQGKTARGRVRALQSHGKPHLQVQPGRRVAINLAGIAHRLVKRGDALVHLSRWAPTAVFDASLEVLASLGHDVSRRGAYHAYIGSGEHVAKLRVIGPSAIQPGETGFVRIWLAHELPLLPGDRYILREAGRSETVGGGEVLDVAPILAASVAKPDKRIERVVAERKWVDAEYLERITGQRIAPNAGGRWVVDPNALKAALVELTAALEKAGSVGIDMATLDDLMRSLIYEMDGVDSAGGIGRLRSSAAQPLEDHPYLEQLRKHPYSPPDPIAVERMELRQLLRAGLITSCDGTLFATSAVEEAISIVASLLENEPGGVTVAQVRDALGTSRKFVLPLISHLDATGLTRRRGDLRIAGPLLQR